MNSRAATPKLKGKVALVTGASSGIGRAAALALAEDGGAVVVVSSGHAQVAIPSCMAYNMAKAAFDGGASLPWWSKRGTGEF